MRILTETYHLFPKHEKHLPPFLFMSWGSTYRHTKDILPQIPGNLLEEKKAQKEEGSKQNKFLLGTQTYEMKKYIHELPPSKRWGGKNIHSYKKYTKTQPLIAHTESHQGTQNFEILSKAQTVISPCFLSKTHTKSRQAVPSTQSFSTQSFHIQAI